jgi:hypothetical protein
MYLSRMLNHYIWTFSLENVRVLAGLSSLLLFRLVDEFVTVVHLVWVVLGKEFDIGLILDSTARFEIPHGIFACITRTRIVKGTPSNLGMCQGFVPCIQRSNPFQGPIWNRCRRARKHDQSSQRPHGIFPRRRRRRRRRRSRSPTATRNLFGRRLNMSSHFTCYMRWYFGRHGHFLPPP